MQEKTNYCRINILSYYFTMEVIIMKNIKNLLTPKIMKGIGTICLLLSALVIYPNSLASGHQPKCPDELLK